MKKKNTIENKNIASKWKKNETHLATYCAFILFIIVVAAIFYHVYGYFNVVIFQLS